MGERKFGTQDSINCSQYYKQAMAKVGQSRENPVKTVKTLSSDMWITECDCVSTKNDQSNKTHVVVRIS